MATLPNDAMDPPVPQWLAQEVATMQATQDRIYNSKVSGYRAAVQAWINENVINRSSNLPPSLFTLPKPQRVIIYAQKGDSDTTQLGVAGSYLDDVDPSLPNAVLPPPLAVVPSSPFLGPGTENPGGTSPAIGNMSDKLDLIIAILRGQSV